MVLRQAGPAGPGRLLDDDSAPPSAGADEMALRVLACGVCHTDLHIVEGELKASLPRVLGYLALATVESLGSGVHDFSVGDRVGVGWRVETPRHSNHFR